MTTVVIKTPSTDQAQEANIEAILQNQLLVTIGTDQGQDQENYQRTSTDRWKDSNRKINDDFNNSEIKERGRSNMRNLTRPREKSNDRHQSREKSSDRHQSRDE